MPWSRDGHVIRLCVQWSRDFDIDFDIKLDLFFTSNRTSNIFHPKILHASFSAFNLFCTDSDITSYTSALAASGKKVLCVLRS